MSANLVKSGAKVIVAAAAIYFGGKMGEEARKNLKEFLDSKAA